MSVPLTKVDSAIAGLSIQDEKPLAPTETEVKKEKKSRRLSSQAEDVWNIKDLGKYGNESSSDVFTDASW